MKSLILVTLLSFLMAAPKAQSQTNDAEPQSQGANETSASITKGSAEDPVVPLAPTRRDFEEMAAGSIKSCESILFPLTFVPGVGSAVGSVIDWGCIVPGAFAIDHLSAEHTQKGHTFGPAILALFSAKLFRAAVFYPLIGAAIAAVLAYTGGASAALVAANAPHYIPVGAAGLITSIGASFIIARQIEKRGAECVFGCIYFGLTKDDENLLSKPKELSRSKALEGVNKGFSLLAIASGARPDDAWKKNIPVVGPLLQIDSRSSDYKKIYRRAAMQYYQDEARDLAALDKTIDITVATEEYMMSAAHVFLIGGALAFGVGTIFSAYAFDQSGDVTQFAVYSATTGIVGMALSGAGVALVGSREVVQIARPWLFSLNYGWAEPLALNAE